MYKNVLGYISNFLPRGDRIICQVVAYREIKNKPIFQTISAKSGRGRLREVDARRGVLNVVI